MSSQHRHCIAILGFLALLATGAAFGQCGSLDNAYGPFDYRTAPESARHIVGIYHFTPDIENLIVRPKVVLFFGAELDYTLRAFPNQPPALLTMLTPVMKGRTDYHE